MYKLLDENHNVIAERVTFTGIKQVVEKRPIEATYIVHPDGHVQAL